MDNLVVISTRQDSDLILSHLIHKAMFSVDSPRPTTGKVTLQRLRLSNSMERVALNVFDQLDDAQGLAAILLYPPSQILKRSGIKFQASRRLRQG